MSLTTIFLVLHLFQASSFLQRISWFITLWMVGEWILYWLTAKGIEWLIEDQAFLPYRRSSPTPDPLSQVRKLDRRHTGRLRKRNNILLGDGGQGGVGGDKSYDGEKAWSSVNHSIHLWLTGRFSLLPTIVLCCIGTSQIYSGWRIAYKISARI